MKKVFYILNLLFLTLSVFGESVFAAAAPPTQYVLADGSVDEIENPSSMKNFKTAALTATSSSSGLATGWYYLTESFTTNSNASICLGATSNINVVVVSQQSINLGTGGIFVPEGASLTFWAAPGSNTNEPDNGVVLTITCSASFVIGNNTNTYQTSNFGTITFNSGSYTITNSKGVNDQGVAIGSLTGGGTVNINQEAEVNAKRQSGSGIVIGTVAEDQKCSINVTGGLLDCTLNSNYAFEINAGTNGQVNVSSQGKILSIINPTGLDNWKIADSGGIIGYPAGGQYSVPEDQWAALVGGTVTLPINGSYPQDLEPPYGDQWRSIIVQSNGNLTLGTTNTDGVLEPATFMVGGGQGSYVYNYGDVTINQIKQNGNYPSLWNNYPGSTLTIADEATLRLWQGDFVNFAAGQGQNPGQVTIEGELNFPDSGNFQNNGNTTLDGDVNFTNASSSFQNSGALDIGPIGTVNGGDSPNLINEAGDTVTSENDTVSLLVYMGEV